MTTQPNATEIRHFFEQLYPDIQDGWLVLSQPDSDPAHVHPNGKRWLRSEWLNLAQTSHARVAEIAATLSAQDTVYLGVALQRPDCLPDVYHRSTNAGAYVVPGLWFALDLAYGQHAASTLPTTDVWNTWGAPTRPCSPSGQRNYPRPSARPCCECSIAGQASPISTTKGWSDSGKTPSTNEPCSYTVWRCVV